MSRDGASLTVARVWLETGARLSMPTCVIVPLSSAPLPSTAL